MWKSKPTLNKLELCILPITSSSCCWDTEKHIMISNRISNKNKDWSIGAKVSVGFMKNLEVIAIRAEKDFMPDIYTLLSSTGKKYEFIPHNGLYAI